MMPQGLVSNVLVAVRRRPLVLFRTMNVFGRGVFPVWSLVAALLLLAGAGTATVGHTDCHTDEVACACVCHDTAALQSHPDVFIPHLSAKIVCSEVNGVDFVFLHDIFRPPVG